MEQQYAQYGDDPQPVEVCLSCSALHIFFLQTYTRLPAGGLLF